MTTFSTLPRLLRGAIIALGPGKQLTSAVVFQYNPDTLTRTLTARATGAQADKGEALRLKGPPEESIKLDIELDAADQPELFGLPAPGVGAALAALETLLYPSATRVVANEVLLRFGNLEIIPPEAPLTLFVWNLQRVLPVRLSGLSITEEAFDAMLNPTRAKVGLELHVLSYHDLGLVSVGGAIFMAHQVAKELLARAGGAASLGYALNMSRGG